MEAQFACAEKGIQIDSLGAPVSDPAQNVRWSSSFSLFVNTG
jgi:hypothetical protein